MLKKIIPSGIAALLAANLLSGFQKGDAAKGKELFEQCSVCHNADSEEKKMGPGLKGLFKRAKLNNGKAVNEANVRGVINAGGNGMRAYEIILRDEGENLVVADLKTL